MSDFYKTYAGKRVLITGHTGFKGSWLAIWLHTLGAEVFGVSLDPPTRPSHFQAAHLDKIIDDSRENIECIPNIKRVFSRVQPDFVFHLAAQALVGVAHEQPTLTWKTNLIGTINILECLRLVRKRCCAVIVTSDKCYENLEWVWGYRETDKLGGQDPYSASKAAAEIAFHSYARTYLHDTSLVTLASARAGNVIGGGDWAEGRLIPDCVKAWSSGKEVQLRNPTSTRPWQHVLEPLSGYLQLASRLEEDKTLNAESFNFGPSTSVSATVADLAMEMSASWPGAVVQKLTSLETNAFYEAKLLQLNCDKARHLLNWQPTLDFAQTAQFTAEWYREFYKGEVSMLDISKKQISQYMELSQRNEKKV